MINSFQKKLEQVQKTVVNMLELEKKPEGLLSDVEEILFGDKSSITEYPAVWILEERVEPKEASLGPKAQEIDLCTMQFYCLDFDLNMVENSYELCRDLALRVADSLEKHCLITDKDEECDEYEPVFNFVKFKSLEPTQAPVGSAKAVSMACLRYEFCFTRERDFCRIRYR